MTLDEAIQWGLAAKKHRKQTAYVQACAVLCENLLEAGTELCNKGAEIVRLKGEGITYTGPPDGVNG